MAEEIVYKSDIEKSTSAIIASDLMDELLAIRDSFDISYWRLGDVTNIIINQAIANGAEDIKMILYRRIGQIVGKHPKTIRYYAAVAGFYPQEIRERYQLLPFSHFSFAMRFRDSDSITFSKASKCARVLDYAQDNAEEYHGLPPSVSALQDKFSGREQLPSGDGVGKKTAPDNGKADVPLIDTFPISSNGDRRDRVDVVESRRVKAVKRLAVLINEIVSIVQFLDNSVLSQLVSRLVEHIRYYIEHEDLEILEVE